MRKSEGRSAGRGGSSGRTTGGSAKKRRRGRGGGGGGGAKRQPTLTSLPTGRAAYTETRRWLLDQHGPVCAYCDRKVAERSITLDHVTPRKGLTAYDRRDNLVLSCKTCNSAKADKPILVFLLASRARVIAMYKYGQHLSHQLVEMVKDLLPEHERPVLATRATGKGARRKSARELFGDDEGPSPYLDD
jgi:hypothetical protein